MDQSHPNPTSLAGKIGIALLFILIGSLIIIVFSQYRPLLSGPADLWGRIALLAALLGTALLLRRNPALEAYWQVAIGLFILGCAVSLDWWAARFVVDFLGGFPDTPAGLALEKLKTAALVALAVIALTRASGASLGSIYLQRGRLKAGLVVGLVCFGIAAAGSVPISKLLFTARDFSRGEFLAWAPWITLMVLANAANEELLFRGLFLRKLEPFYGKLLSNCLIVLVFTGLHLGVTYTRDQLLFLAILVPLSLAWGALTQKTEGIWGSILFHAGTDIPVFLAVFSNRF